jgi:hypothetical protein
MRFLWLSALVLPVFAGLIPVRPASPDVQILNYMLALQLLHKALFEQGLGKFTPDDFVSAGCPQFTHGRLKQILKHSEIHIAFLTQAIMDSGSDVVQPCTYALYVLITCAYMRPDRFYRPLGDPQSLIRTGRDLATVLASASYGAIGQMENSDYRTTIGSISGIISRQAGWLNSAVLEKNAWNTAFDAPLTFRQSWTSVQRYISSCPLDNALCFPSGFIDPFVPLNIEETLIPGSRGSVNFDKMEESSADRALYVSFMTGIGESHTPLEKNGFFDVPRGVANLGAVYAFVTSDGGPITDENILAGPAVAQSYSSSLDNSF